MIEVFPEALKVKVKSLFTLVTALVFRLLTIPFFLFIILNHESYLSRLRLVAFAEPVLRALKNILVNLVVVWGLKLKNHIHLLQ